MRRALLVAAATLAALPAAARAEPAPFGHACIPQSGVRFCPTPSDDLRVPTWDGVPLDVDVTLPGAGVGPWPTIVMLHGFPGDKTALEGPSADPRLQHRNNVFYAQRGYAVVNHSARGFGRSCGTESSRTPDCARGWTHLFDQRYEARDVQHLLGLLVDQAIARPGALGVTGESGGSLQTLELAWLRNRVRLPDGRFATWRSPAGRRLGMQAAYPTFAGHDIVAALVPNGRFLDFERRTGDSRRPLGIANNGFINALLLVAQAQGFIAPRGADPTADLLAWKEVTDRGEPYGAAARGIADQLTRFHSASRLTGTPAPILMQDGWADDLFPASEALRVYNRLRQANLGARVAIQLIDSGHARGGRHPNQELAANDQAIRFFDAYLQRRTRPPPPRPGAVLAYTQHCPRDAAGGLRFTGRSWARLHPGAFRFAGPRNQMVSSAGGSSELAQAFTPNFGTSDACKTVPVERSPGTAVYQRAVRVGVTLLGRPTVTARIATSGPFGQLDSRLWDVDPAAGTQLLVTRGAYRLTAGQRGTITFQLNGNGWRFAPGHVVKLELLGRDAPYLRASNGTFDVRVASATVELPVHEPPSRAAGIARPRHAIDPAVAARR